MDNNMQNDNHEEIAARQTAKMVVNQVISDIYAERNLKANEFIKKYWEIYKSKFESNQNINGKVFEELIAISLIREGILPFYMQAKVAFIPYVNYDFIIYTNDIGPISLSAKTSLRERWKQADLEAVAMKYIHRKSKSYVVTLDNDAVRRRRVDRSQLLGIDDFVLADAEEFNELMLELKKYSLSLSPSVEVVSSNIVITSDNISERYTYIRKKF